MITSLISCCNDCELRFREIARCSMNVAQEIEYREYIYKYIIYEASPLEKAVVKLVQKVDRSTEDGGESYLNFKCPLRRQHGRI